ncbi:MAG: hypothetical protein AB4041_14800 [Microcystaceae cyanobacterium]
MASIYSQSVQGVSPKPPSHSEICAIITSMPQAENTDKFLDLLKTDRSQVIKDLITLKSNMEQYDAEGYGWQNVINSSSQLEPRPDAWLMGALRIGCESDNNS